VILQHELSRRLFSFAASASQKATSDWVGAKASRSWLSKRDAVLLAFRIQLWTSSIAGITVSPGTLEMLPR